MFVNRSAPGASLFVKSLVSPYPHLNNYYERPKRNTKVQSIYMSSLLINICICCRY
ncbi:hypothetical protein Hanom_Chr15g01355621 [Helianthus anomalus]